MNKTSHIWYLHYNFSHIYVKCTVIVCKTRP